MEEFWPHAMLKMTEEERMKDIHHGHLFSVSSLYTIRDAIETIRLWNDHYRYNIDYAWIVKSIDGKHVAIIDVDYAPLDYSVNVFYHDTKFSFLRRNENV